MLIRNVYTCKRDFEKSHNGIGSLEKVRAFSKKDFKTNLDFIDYVIVKPGETIGEHIHGDNEEIYFFIEGCGTMLIGNEKIHVSEGDIAVNSFQESHGLINNGNIPIKILIFQVNN